MFKLSRPPPYTNRTRASGHLLEYLKAGIGLEGLPERDAGLIAEIVVRQAAEKARESC